MSAEELDEHMQMQALEADLVEITMRQAETDAEESKGKGSEGDFGESHE
jgi:hypothetical protein